MEYPTPLIEKSTNAEKAFLGACLIQLSDAALCEYDCTSHIVSIDLPEECFYIIRHKWIHNAIKRSTSLIQVSDLLDKENRLSYCGGFSYLMDLITSCDDSCAISEYAQAVQDYHQKRSLVRKANEILVLTISDTPFNSLPQTVTALVT